jgi:AraC-like DNA-binding protein
MASTTVAAWPLAVLETLNGYGVDGPDLLAQAGLDLAVLRANPGGRVPTVAMTRLWALATEQSGDPAMGLQVGKTSLPMHLRVMGLLIQTAPTLGHILEMAVRYQRLISTGVTVRLQQRPDAVGLEICCLPDVVLHPASIDAFVAAHVSNLRRLSPEGGVQQVMLQRSAPADAGPWRQILGCPVTFEQPGNIVWHHRDRLAAPLLLGDAGLWRQHETLARQELAALDATPPLIQTLQGLLRAQGDALPGLAELAAAVAMSERSLRRRLAELGSGYRQLVDAWRSERAGQLVRGGESLAEVAHRLGFSDASNFSKAFRRWYGMSPDTYRQQDD